MSQATAQEISDTFVSLDNWEDRYRYIIGLGGALPKLADHEKVEANRIHGCVSQMWIVSGTEQVDGRSILTWRAESDAMIVQGLVAVVLALHSGRTATEIVQTDTLSFLSGLGLLGHLTKQRTNGLAAIVSRIRADAQTLAFVT